MRAAARAMGLSNANYGRKKTCIYFIMGMVLGGIIMNAASLVNMIEPRDEKCKEFINNEHHRSALFPSRNATMGETIASGQTSSQSTLPLCPATPPGLRGDILLDDTISNLEKMTMTDIEKENSGLNTDGTFSTPGCAARHNVLIVLPYRNRLAHLTQFLAHMIPVFQRQQLNFRIIVPEQIGKERFNKGMLMNTAVKMALEKNWKFECVIFHDIDLILRDDRNLYRCAKKPLHMSKTIEKTEGTYNFYPYLVGGVFNLRKEHFIEINGYSNYYWGWGGEDDDMYFRVKAARLEVTRPPDEFAKYKALEHKSRKGKEPKSNERGILVQAERLIDRRKFDGLSTLTTKIVSVKEGPLYTHLEIDVGKKPGHL